MNVNELAVCSWSLQPNGVDDLIAKVAATGLCRVQLHLNPLGTQGWADTPARLEAAGVDVVSGMVECVGEDYSSIVAITRTGGVVPDETWPATFAAMQAAAEHAKSMKLDLVTFHAGFIPHDAADATAVKIVGRLREVADVFAAVKCRVALETGQESADALLALLDEIDREDVGVNFDPANMILYGSGEPISALRALLPRVRQIHLKDAKASTKPGDDWGDEVVVGEGEVDWSAFFTTIKNSSFSGNFCIEREAGESRVADVSQAVRYMRAKS